MNRIAEPGTVPVRLLLFAHGSRDPEWAVPFEGLRDDVADRIGSERVRLAFLGFRAPSLLEAAQEAVEDGVGLLIVVPLFFGAGRHVRVDLPGLVRMARQRNPTLEFEVAGTLTEDAGFRRAMLERVVELAARSKIGAARPQVAAP